MLRATFGPFTTQPMAATAVRSADASSSRLAMLYGKKSKKPEPEAQPIPRGIERERLIAEYIATKGVTKCKPGEGNTEIPRQA